MQLWKSLIVIAIGTTFARLARADCNSIPNPVRRYVATQTGWTILASPDLADEQEMWVHYHGRHCPGFAQVNFDGNGRDAYAVALVHKIGSVLHERLELVRPHGTDVTIIDLTPDWDVSGPWVVFRAKPHTYMAVETNKRFTLRSDGVIFEKMESADHLYWLNHGKVAHIMLSD
jgi:hypothetical protein